MSNEFDFETYLNISPNKIGIYLLDKKKYKLGPKETNIAQKALYYYFLIYFF